MVFDDKCHNFMSIKHSVINRFLNVKWLLSTVKLREGWLTALVLARQDGGMGQQGRGLLQAALLGVLGHGGALLLVQGLAVRLVHLVTLQTWNTVAAVGDTFFATGVSNESSRSLKLYNYGEGPY